MDMGLTRSLRISTVGHAVALALLILCPLVFAGFRKQKPPIPVEFTVVVHQAKPEPWIKPSPPAQVAAQPDPEEVVVHREPAPARARQRTPKPQPDVQLSHTRVMRREPVQAAAPVQPTTTLSRSEIWRRLALGAKPGAENSPVPDAEDLSFAVIRTALNNAWVQPSAEEAGSAVVEVEIQLGVGGSVNGWRIVKRSGVAAMDASVARAVQSVKQIRGLPPSFVSRHSSVTIAFRVE